MTQQDATGIRREGWQADHARRYLETNGEEGHIWRGVPTLLLTTTGRRTGEPYMTPLIYGQDDGRYIIVASKGGAPEHPQWYRNLLAQPEVGLQVLADRFKARARPASAEEKPALWKLMTRIWPDYDAYQARSPRKIPVVILERI
jgi:deazaflavin-dependent oxidoreductase (nitroreductase family)